LEDQRDGDTGHLTLGLPPSLGSTLTVPLVKAFVERLPKARLATVEGLSVYMLEWLGVGRVDCALVYNAAASPRVDMDPLLIDELLLIEPRESRAPPRAGASRGAAVSRRAGNSKGSDPAKGAASAAMQPARGEPIPLKALADCPLIMPSRPHAIRMAVETALAGVDRKIRIAYEIECIPAIVDLVRQGHGFGVLPRSAVTASRWAGEISVRPVRDPLLTISLSIATSSQRPRTPLMRKSIEVIRAVAQREMRLAEHR
jgi:LysR family nitrogen assimilation transcriptional regulator